MNVNTHAHAPKYIYIILPKRFMHANVQISYYHSFGRFDYFQEGEKWCINVSDILSEYEMEVERMLHQIKTTNCTHKPGVNIHQTSSSWEIHQNSIKRIACVVTKIVLRVPSFRIGIWFFPLVRTRWILILLRLNSHSVLWNFDGFDWIADLSAKLLRYDRSDGVGE